MVKRAMKFTPQVMLSAPRRSAGVPSFTGEKILYTTNSYSFKTHKKDSELRVVEANTGASIQLAQNEDISDLNWLSGNEFVGLSPGTNGTTELVVGDASWAKSASEPSSDVGVWKNRHYIAGVIDGSAANLKVTKLDDEGKEWAVLVSAPAGKDGNLFNEQKASKTHSTGRVYSSLFVRHWDRWETKEHNALWFGKLTRFHGSEGWKGYWRLNKLTNALSGTGLECPVRPFGGTDNFDLSKHCIIFVAKDLDLDPSLNTKVNIYLIPMNSWGGEGGKKRTLLKVVNPGFEGASTSPVCSPDGKQAAFLSMKKNGHEADKNHIFLLSDIGASDLTAKKVLASSTGGIEGDWDRSPSAIRFSANGRSLFAIAEEYGTAKLFTLGANIVNQEEPRALTKRGSVSDCRPLEGGNVFISASSLIDNSTYAIVDPVIQLSQSEEIFEWSHSNSGNGNKFGLRPEQVSSIWTPASNTKVRKEIHSIVIRPSNFDPSKTYPVSYVIHGGPQGAWGDNWSTRWNLAIFAEQGYIVIAPNPTGSTGYGQEFTDSISGNWGGDPYQDIVNVFDWVGENMPQADNERAVALGGSYGGYMINWIQGQDLGRKFKALVNHDGTFTPTGMLATDELYFLFTDLGGTPWYNPDYARLSTDKAREQSNKAQRDIGTAMFSDWRKWDPSEYLDKWATPELVIHSEKDYRVNIADGLATFNVLQARGVESKLLTFPDENHWVLKPENSLVWHKVVLNWINKHVGLELFADEDEDSEEFFGGTRSEKEEVVELDINQGKPET